MLNLKKIVKYACAFTIAASMLFSSFSAFAANEITWKVKDYITTTGISGTVGGTWGTGHGGPVLSPAYEIVYEQYLNGVATGLVISGTQAEKYGLKGYASSITRPNSWYDANYPNYEYEEIFADGEYTGLVWPTGARLADSQYKDIRMMWEVGGTHKEYAKKHAFLGGKWFTNGSYPLVYTGTNADVVEENKYYGFDVFEIYDLENNKARDVEVVLDKEGNNVNTTNLVKKDEMHLAASANTIDSNITALVNDGNGYDSAFYALLNANKSRIVEYRTDANNNKVPVYDFTGVSADYFDNRFPIQHYFQLSGPTYNKDGSIADKFGLVIDAYEDCVDAKANPAGTGDWKYSVNKDRFGFYTNNLVTTHDTAKAISKWEFAGWEAAEPYRVYEFLSIEGIVFDGDIDNDTRLDTPIIFRYPTSGTANITTPVGGSTSTSGLFNSGKVSYSLADPKVEWRFAFAEAAYPHEIFAQRFVENWEGKMIATGEYKGIGKYAKENLASTINPTAGVPSGHKHYQMRLEWTDSQTGMLYASPYFDVNEHAGEYLELTGTADPSYLENPYDYVVPGAPVFINPEAIRFVDGN